MDEKTQDAILEGKACISCAKDFRPVDVIRDISDSELGTAKIHETCFQRELLELKHCIEQFEV